MKKLQSLVFLAVCLFFVSTASAQTQEVLVNYTSPLKTSYKTVLPEGTISGPSTISSSTYASTFYFLGDPIPDDAFWSIDGVEYASAGPGGNTVGGRNILTSAFVGLGIHSVELRFYDGVILYNYAYPLTVTVN